MNKTHYPLTVAMFTLFVTITTNVSAAPVSFKKEIAPILRDNCLACHDAKKAESGYRLDSYAHAIAEGDSGTAGFTAGDFDDSESLRRILSDDESERMPLESDPLSDQQIALIKRWVKEGAKYDGADTNASLVSIIPPPTHPNPPQVYSRTVPITSLHFTPDGEQLIAGGYNELTIWNPTDGKLLRRIKNVGLHTYALAVSPNGKVLAAACGSPGKLGEVRLFDLATGKLAKVLGTSTDVLFDVAFDPAGARLAVCGADSMIHIYDVASGSETRRLTSHSDWVMDVDWNKDGTKLASASRDKTAKVFNAKTGELLTTYSAHRQPVKGVVFHQDGKRVYSCGADKRILPWNIVDGKNSGVRITLSDDILKLDVIGGFLFAVSADKSARQYEMKANKQIHKYAGHTDWVLSAHFHPDSKRLATGSFDGEVRIWNTADGKLLHTFLAAPGLVKPKK